MNREYLEYYKGIEKEYDLDKLSAKSAELFDIVNKYHFYGKRAKNIYLKILYKLIYCLSLHIAKKESANALKK